MSETKMVRFEPAAPVQNVAALTALLDAKMDEMVKRAAEGANAERITKIALRSVTQNRTLLQCTGESVLLGIMEAVELGLEPGGSLGEAWLVPYGKSRKVNGRWEKYYEAQLILGWQGLAKLARQSGEVVTVEAEVVYENDHFVFAKGLTPRLEWTPALTGDRGKAIGAWALARLRSGDTQMIWMREEEIDEVKAVSRAKSGPWEDWTDEMRKKSVFRRLAKWLPLSSQVWRRAVEVNDRETDFGSAESRREASQGATDDVNARLGLAGAPESPQDASEPNAGPNEGEEEIAQEGAEEAERIDQITMRRLHAVAKEAGADHDAIKKVAQESFGTESLRDLTLDQAKELIAFFKDAA